MKVCLPSTLNNSLKVKLLCLQAEGSAGALTVLATGIAALYLFLQANLTG